jgi:hypothetical protein
LQNAKIFISHAKEDNPIIHRVIKILDDNNIKKWVDLEQLDELGSSVNEKINDGISSSNYFLLMWSIHASRSSFVKNEYNAATSGDYDKLLTKIIIKLDETRLPPLLADKKYYEVTEIELEDVVEGIVNKINYDLDDKTKKFDEYLDKITEKIEILGIEYTVSFILKNALPERYQEEFEAWKELEK